jgi:hypothetical protein
MGNWVHWKILICWGVWACKHFLYLLAIECTSKFWFVKMFELVSITYIYWSIECISNFWFVEVLEIAKIMYKYWPIECIEKPSFVGVFELARIMYIYWSIECNPKTFICQNVQTCKNYLCILVDSMHSQASFIEMFKLKH